MAVFSLNVSRSMAIRGGVVAVVLLLIVIGRLTGSSASLSGSGAANVSGTIEVRRIVELTEARLKMLQKRYDYGWTLNELGLKIPPDDIQDYRGYIDGVYRRWFVPKGQEPDIVHDQLYRNLILQSSVVPHLGSSQSMRRAKSSTSGYSAPQVPPYPKVIYTTAKKPNFLDQFRAWSLENEDWEVRFFDNPAITVWLKQKFAAVFDLYGRRRGGRIAIASRRADQEPSWDQVGLMREFLEMPDGVLKADFFRYIVLLLSGGIYSDTDTGGVKPLDRWPGMWRHDPNVITISDSLLTALPTLLGLGNATQVLAGEEEAFEPPSLVVSLEHDHLKPFNKDWKKEKLSRGMQIIQWTIAARPHHPIFLDVLGRILNDMESERAQQDGFGQRLDMILNVLDFTGPGVFSDAVFRYMLARWGVLPQQVSNKEHPVRVGDILILPEHSFRTTIGESPKLGGPELGPNELVWHGFAGSWKGTQEEVEQAYREAGGTPLKAQEGIDQEINADVIIGGRQW